MTNICIAILLTGTLLVSPSEALSNKPSREELKTFYEKVVSQNSRFKDFVYRYVLGQNDLQLQYAKEGIISKTSDFKASVYKLFFGQGDKYPCTKGKFVSKHTAFKDYVNKFIFGQNDNQLSYMHGYGPYEFGPSSSCDICKFAIEGILLIISRGGTQDDVVKFVTTLCTDLKIQDERVCHYVTREYKV